MNEDEAEETAEASDEKPTHEAALAAFREEPIVLLGKTVDLVLPNSPSDRYDVIDASNTMQQHRAAALAVAICWPKLRRTLGRQGIRNRGNVHEYAGAVFDYLINEGADAAVLLIAGNRAQTLCAIDLPGLQVPSSDQEREELTGN